MLNLKHGFLLLITLNFVLIPNFFLLAETIEEKEARLKAELEKVEQDIAKQQSLLKGQQQQTATIKRDVDVLTTKVNTAQLNIKSKKIEIERLSGDIGDKISTINKLEEKLNKEQRSLAELLRETRELDDNTLAELILEKDSVSTFLVDVGRFQAVQRALQDVLGRVRETKQNTEKVKSLLEVKKDQELDAKQAIEVEKAKVERLNAEKKIYLDASKSQEDAYKKVIAAKEKERATIRNALFSLRGAANITFGQALEYAKVVSAKTGVRPAFLLAIITQESNLGQNIGTCNRPGDPESKSWRNIMKPNRDYEPYLRITKELGLDPDSMPLSCPYQGGYGGAMGPAQFIPSTWEGMKSAVAKLTGNNPPNPWNAQDAFAASGLYLRDLGANTNSYAAERKAALRYYAGSNWNNPKNAFYGDQVMAITTKYQSQIDILQND